MNSSPPTPRDDRARALVRVASAEAFVLDEGVIFFSVEGAPTEACRTETAPDGSLTFTTTLQGPVTAVQPDELVLDVRGHRVVVRHLLPGAIDLSGLLESRVLVTVQQRYRGRGRATIDAEIRDAGGRLVLWARDGRLPSDADARGLSMRVCLDPDGHHRLALSQAQGVVSLAAPGIVRVERDGVTHDALLIRLGPDDASFVILRRG